MGAFSVHPNRSSTLRGVAIIRSTRAQPAEPAINLLLNGRRSEGSRPVEDPERPSKNPPREGSARSVGPFSSNDPSFLGQFFARGAVAEGERVPCLPGAVPKSGRGGRWTGGARSHH